MRTNTNVRGDEFLDSSPINEFQNISDSMIFQILMQKNREPSLDDAWRLVKLSSRKHIDAYTLCSGVYQKMLAAHKLNVNSIEQKYSLWLRYTTWTFLLVGISVGFIVGTLF